MKEELLNYFQNQLIESFDNNPRNDIGMGKAATVLFAWYRYKCFNNPEDLKTCRDYLTKLAVALNKSLVKPSPYIFIEIVEICYLLTLLKSDDVNETFSIIALQKDLEDVIRNVSDNFLSAHKLDPYTGGGYLFNYFADQGNVTMSNRFIDDIKSKSYIDDSGRRIIQLEKEKDIQLGITHGISFILLFLSKTKEFNNADTRKLLGEFTQTVYSQIQDDFERDSFFSDFLDGATESKLSLCYGDLGIFYSLAQAFDFLNDTNKRAELNSMIVKVEERLKVYFNDFQNTSLINGSGGVLLLVYFLKQKFPSSSLENLFHKQLELYKIEIMKTISFYSESGKIFSQRDLTFSEGLTGSLIMLMGFHCNDLGFSKLFYLGN